MTKRQIEKQINKFIRKVDARVITNRRIAKSAERRISELAKVYGKPAATSPYTIR
jgi:hypothetical protein